MESVKRILHVDENNLLRYALMEAFSAKPLLSNGVELKIVQSLSSGTDAIAACENTSFDLILLDINMSETNGYVVAKKILAMIPEQKILILSARPSARDTQRSINLGIQGHLSKDCDMDELRFAIQKVFSGKTYFNTDNLVHLLSGSVGNVNFSKDELTLLQLFCNEKTAAQAARIMNRSVRAINYLKRELQKKAGVHSKAGLAIYAVRNNLI